jgi:hypothetical protein
VIGAGRGLDHRPVRRLELRQVLCRGRIEPGAGGRQRPFVARPDDDPAGARLLRQAERPREDGAGLQRDDVPFAGRVDRRLEILS